MEIRLHGRGGQGGVTCAKILAAVYASRGRSVQSFGDYAGERSGAPVRAYTRVGDGPMESRNKVDRPDHVVVLDPTLLGEDVVAGLAPGGTLLVNTPLPPAALRSRFPAQRIATVDATAIARRHRIGTRSVVIVNTTIAGAFVRALDLPLEALEEAYCRLGLSSNFAAAREAHDTVAIAEPAGGPVPSAAPAAAAGGAPACPVAGVVPLAAHHEGPPPALEPGSWRTQAPHSTEREAPCGVFCPAGNDVVGFVRAVATHGAAAASEILARTTPLPGVCGRVCAAPCMQGCNRSEYDGAVNIRALERWIADNGVTLESAVPIHPRPRRVAVVGGGPAGISAAYHLARLGHDVTIHDGERELGGLRRTGIPSYRLPRAVLDGEIRALLALGVRTRLGRFLDAGGVEELVRESHAVILATGLQVRRGIDGTSELPAGAEQGLDFLHRVNVEGGARLQGHVVVLGGGIPAMDCARSAVRAGADRVTVMYRRSREEMPAIAGEIAQATEEGVRFRFLRQPLGLGRRPDGHVASVVSADVELGAPDESGRRRPLVTTHTSELSAEHVLLALGQRADRRILPRGWDIVDGRVREGATPLPPSSHWAGTGTDRSLRGFYPRGSSVQNM